MSRALVEGWFPELDLNGVTKYAAVVNALERGVREGHLTPGMKLPPQRDIAEYFNVTIATVTKAISVAARRGLIVARAGSGTFVADSVAEVPSGTSTDSNTQDLSLNAPPLSVVAEALEENVRELAADRSPSKLFDYEPIPGGATHRWAGARWLSLRGLQVNPDNIFITQGAHEGLLVSLSALTQPGDVVVCERLNYTGLRRIGQLLRIKLVGVDVDEEGLCVDALPALIRQHQPKAIVCTPVIHNPTTATLSKARRDTLLATARKAEIPIVEDDIYGHFAGDKHAPLLASWPDGVILITSLSKVVASGLRVGYIVAPDRLTPRLTDAMFMLGWTAPLAQMSFATRLIESGRAEHCLTLHRQEASTRLQLAKQILGASLQTDISMPTYHAWIQTGRTRLEDITSELYRQGIQVSPASHFLIGDGEIPLALRLSLGRVSEARQLEPALGLIAHRLSFARGPALGSIV